MALYLVKGGCIFEGKWLGSGYGLAFGWICYVSCK